jgi:mevalonate kinase
MITASAPAKIILFGEHAVVYHQPAIAIPLSDVRAYATVEFDGQARLIAEDLGQTIPINLNADDVEQALLYTLRLTLAQIEHTFVPMTIRLRSEIPLASGLGSGAAVATALARAVSQALGHPLADDALNQLVYQTEKLHHGTPSGVDNTVIVYERPMLFLRGEGDTALNFQPLNVSGNYHLLVANSGQGALTKIAVGDVRQLYLNQPDSTRPVIEAIGALTLKAQSALLDGDIVAVGRLMDENHALLQKLTVSSTTLDRLTMAARQAGALGAKLSGGGRGGNMIALVKSDRAEAVQTALLNAGAVSVLQTILRGDTL